MDPSAASASYIIPNADFDRRVRFVCELAKCLHQFGTSAPRLEAAIDRVAQRLRLYCHGLSTPTSIILSFSDAGQNDAGLARHTQVIRLEPGSTDLGRLTQADAVAEQVSRNRISLEEGHHALQRIAAPRRASGLQRALHLAAFGASAASVSLLLRGGMAECLSALGIGIAVGALLTVTSNHRHWSASGEALAAFLATLLATVVRQWLPIQVNTVVIASLIALLPGLMLTTAIVELSHQHWVSGAARFAGAVTVLLKLAFGSIAATQVAAWLLPAVSGVAIAPALPGWVPWLAVSLSALSFAVLFKARVGDYWVVVAATFLSYGISQTLGGAWDSSSRVFIGGLCIVIAGNVYGRLAKKPGALVRVPGIILLVPGSVGYQSLSLVFARNVDLSLDAAFATLTLLTYLVGGMLLGNILVPPRKTL